MAPSTPIGFLCTRPSPGFDPICKVAHTEFVIALTIVALGVGVAVGRRLTRGRRRLARAAAGLVGAVVGTVLGLFASLAIGNVFLG